jgi:hypothetical protein
MVLGYAPDISAYVQHDMSQFGILTVMESPRLGNGRVLLKALVEVIASGYSQSQQNQLPVLPFGPSLKMSMQAKVSKK